MLRPVSEVADMEALLGPASTSTLFSSVAGVTSWVSFVIWKNAGPVGLVETIVEHVGLCFVAQKGPELRGSSSVREPATSFF